MQRLSQPLVDSQDSNQGVQECVNGQAGEGLFEFGDGQVRRCGVQEGNDPGDRGGDEAAVHASLCVHADRDGAANRSVSFQEDARPRGSDGSAVCIPADDKGLCEAHGNLRGDHERVRPAVLRTGVHGEQGLLRQRDDDLCRKEGGSLSGAGVLGTSAEQVQGGSSRTGEERQEAKECPQRGQVAEPSSVSCNWFTLSGQQDSDVVLQKMLEDEVVVIQQVLVQDNDGIFQVEIDEVMPEDKCMVEATLNPKLHYEDVLDETPEIALPKKTKTQLRKAAKTLYGDEAQSLAVEVSELYSPPRLTAEGKRQGLQVGGAYDIKTGFDLRQESDEKKMWRTLQEEDPLLFVNSPPCTSFTLMQELNYPKMDPKVVFHMVSEGLRHMRLCVKACMRQIQRGKLFLFEHPLRSRAWNEPELQELMCMPGVHVCRRVRFFST